MFSKILVANRGEIAVRIIRACREMGIATVAIYSEADKNAMHVQLADESYCVGGNRVADSYLNIPAILTVAIESGAQAIHPGYGLLSENAKFVSLCEQCNINFIGPTSGMIAMLGDKDNARKTMRAAGVPVTPGCDIVEDIEIAKKEAEKIGFPLLIKARSGAAERVFAAWTSPSSSRTHFSRLPPRLRRRSVTAHAILKNSSSLLSTSKCSFSATSTTTLFVSVNASARFSERTRR